MSWIIPSRQTVLIICLVVLPALFVWRENAKGATVVAASIATALLFTRLPDISSFKLWGLAANLQRQSQQVEVTLAQLQQLAASLTEGSLNELAFSGQTFEGLSNSAKFAVHDKIIDSLKALGVSSQDVTKAQKLWITFYGNVLEGLITQQVATHFPHDQITLQFPVLAQSPNHLLPSPDAVQAALKQLTSSDPKLLAFVQAYRSVWLDGTMVNPDIMPFGAGPALGKEAQDLPTSPDGLPPGSEWNNGGTLSSVGN